MRHQVVQRSSGRLSALVAGLASGAAAVVVSHWHVLPPMQCFALLVAGLAILGASAFLGAKWYLPQASKGGAVRIPAGSGRVAHRTTRVHP